MLNGTAIRVTLAIAIAAYALSADPGTGFAKRHPCRSTPAPTRFDPTLPRRPLGPAFLEASQTSRTRRSWRKPSDPSRSGRIGRGRGVQSGKTDRTRAQGLPESAGPRRPSKLRSVTRTRDGEVDSGGESNRVGLFFAAASVATSESGRISRAILSWVTEGRSIMRSSILTRPGRTARTRTSMGSSWTSAWACSGSRTGSMRRS
jgi:hypothetical protein